MAEGNDPAASMRRALVAEAIRALDAYDGSLDSLGVVQFRAKAAVSVLEEESPSPAVLLARREWGQIEIIYAIVLEDERASLHPDEAADVRGAIGALRETLVSVPLA